MSNKRMENTLLLGNGFSRIIFKGIPSWGSLFEEENSKINNYTILYEKYLANNQFDEETVKKDIMKKISGFINVKNINKEIHDIENFGQYLMENNIHNIITTNYDMGIEMILCEICCYQEVESKGLVPEDIYSIRTYRKFINNKTGHEVKLWKIHGDIENIGNVDRKKSVMLGFDHYCGSLSKISNYVKGTYVSHKPGGPKCKIEMIEKCEMEQFDNLSWVELFFNTNVFIVGFGMDFSEIDIWWLLNKHARFKNTTSYIKNNIYYFYNKKYDDIEAKADIFEALKTFQVIDRAIISDNNYIKNIFGEVKRLNNE